MRSDNLPDDAVLFIALASNGLHDRPFIANRPPHLDCVVVKTTNLEVKEAIETFEKAHPDVDTNAATKARATRILRDVKRNITQHTAAAFQRIYDAQVNLFDISFN
jgi:hypothetical protein